jgi:hypothetical protein
VRRLVAGYDAGASERALQVWGLLTLHLWHDWMRAFPAVPLATLTKVPATLPVVTPA